MKYSELTLMSVQGLVVMAIVGSALAMSPRELRKRMDRGDTITVIDIRTPSQYQSGHIPGAINVPASMVREKRLPPLGEVVVCAGGLGREDAETAAVAFRARPGLDVNILDGGFVAWLESGGMATGAAGLRKPRVNYVTYQDLKSGQEEDVVLVDLRATPAGRGKSIPALTDLSREFPGVPVVKDVFAERARRSKDASGDMSRYVLIDNGDGEALRTARALRANNIRRVLVLLGGEEMVRRKGRAGLQRLGPGKGLKEPVEDESGN